MSELTEQLRYRPVGTTAAQMREAADLIDALEKLATDGRYYRYRLAEIMPLFQEARDAICAIPLASAKIRGLDLSLGDRMDVAGTRTREQWDAAQQDQTKPTVNGES